MNKKGFTLIELLAVIVVLGIVIAIAIPGVNLIINNSRKKSFIGEAKLVADSTRVQIASKQLDEPKGDRDAIIVSLNYMDFERGGGKSSYGYDWDYTKSYVLITKNEENPNRYEYYMALLDEGGNGLSLTNIDNLNTNSIVQDPNILSLKEYPLLGAGEVYTVYLESNTIQEVPRITSATIYIGTIQVGDSGSGPNTEVDGAYVVFEYDLNLGPGYVNIHNLSGTDVYVWNGLYSANQSKIENDFDSPDYVFNDLTNRTMLNTRLAPGIYTVATTKFLKTVPIDPENEADAEMVNMALIGVPYFDIIGLGSTSLNSLFLGAMSFNQNISHWNTSNITDMGNMFAAAIIFNQNINGWNTSKVTNMEGMFGVAFAFNQPLDNWNTSKVTNMGQMFMMNQSFNQNLNSWNVSNVTNMKQMFFATAMFNGNITSWNVSKVTDMEQMFSGVHMYDIFTNDPIHVRTPFNQDIRGWNTKNVTNMRQMFNDNKNFNYDISGWNVDNVTNHDMFNASSSLIDIHTPFYQDPSGHH